jgi:hypothetical protein
MLRPVGEIERSSREIEPLPRHVMAPRRHARDDRYPPGDPRYRDRDYAEEGYATDDRDLDDEPVADWSRQMAAIRRHQVTLASAALIVASLVWKASFLTGYFFQQDDFEVLDAARKSTLTWSFLTHVDAGHFFPGVYAMAWVLSREALYNWTAASAVVLVLTAAASLAAWRLLRTMLGNRPAILIPLALYLLTPLAFPNYSWWITAAEAIPLQIALFMSLNSHLQYVWTGRIRHAFAATAWLFFGLAFFEKSAVIPPLLFAITVAFLINRKRLISATWTAVTQLWKAWLLYFGLLGLYVAVFFLSLQTSTTLPKAPASFHVVGTFAWNLIFRTFLPDTLGGPWHWFHPAGTTNAYSWPPIILAWLSLLVALVIIVASVLTRRRAWRGWAILAGWIVLADIVPVAISRLTNTGLAGLLGDSPRYAADAVAVLAIVVGLTFWPIAGPKEEGARSRRPRRAFFGAQWRKAAVALLAVFTVGSIWSVHKFSAQVTPITGAYIDNATKALAETPGGTLIVDTHVPGNVMIGAFQHYGYTSVVLGPLSHGGTPIQWTREPAGNVGNLKIFGPDGRLYTAAISGVTSTARSLFQQCLSPKKSRLAVSLPAISPLLGAYVRVLRIGYLANPASAGTSVIVTYGTESRQITVLSGAHNAYFPVTGAASQVIVQSQGAAGAFCVEKTVVGRFVPLPRTGIPSGGS